MVAVAIDPDQVSAESVHKLLLGSVVPRPIAWTSTIGTDATRNLAPFSFFTVVSTVPPMLSITIERRADGREKDTLANIRATGQLAVNVVTVSTAEAMWTSSEDYPSGVDEFVVAGVTERPAHRIMPPLVSEAPINLECELDRILRPGSDSLVFAQVVLCHFRADLLDEHYHVDTLRFGPLGRVGGAYSPVESLIEPPCQTQGRCGRGPPVGTSRTCGPSTSQAAGATRAQARRAAGRRDR